LVVLLSSFGLQFAFLRQKSVFFSTSLTETFLDETDELLFALVSQLHVFDELAKLNGPVVGHHESVPGLQEEVDELGVVPRRNAAQPGVSRGDVGSHGRLQELAEGRRVAGEASGRRCHALGVEKARRRDRAPAEDVGQDGGAEDVFDDEGDHGGELVLAEGVAQGASPVDVVDGRMGVLKFSF
jgi:hypothetical protein